LQVKIKTNQNPLCGNKIPLNPPLIKGELEGDLVI